jgi:hypothetical protein
MRMYGISLDDYRIMLAEQQHGCGICGRHQSEFDQALHVDHNHTSGKVRGLLCSDCNVGIGIFKDDAAILTQAAKYLTKNAFILVEETV